MYPKIFLKQGKEKPVRARHPWIFSGAIAKTDFNEPLSSGEIVDVYAPDKTFLACGYYNSQSQITVRILTYKPEPIDANFFANRISQALNLRTQLGLNFNQQRSSTTAFRIINAEADLLPGLIVDAYGSFLVVQILTAGMERLKSLLVKVLDELLHPEGIYERSDVEVRSKEGLTESTGLLCGHLPPPRLVVYENHIPLSVDIRQGQKTGFYLDQRENRQTLARIISSYFDTSTSPFTALNVFSYTGGFGVYAAKACPNLHVLNLDASPEALELAQENFNLNNLSQQASYQVGDAFHRLRTMRDQGKCFDLIILDPPKFAPTKHQLVAACRGYKDINLLGFKLLKAGGLLMTFSCSGLIDTSLFQKVVFDAAHDAQRSGKILAKLGHAPDHPLLLSFPEGEYLKGLLISVE